ncbi:MAG: cytosolic purine 5-nucleotidase [Trebouxia sp. A1-2]|nr:MAG: cytosolic purine 5-nucleotidase [Trebouxia sp. A1-2]
MRLPLQAQRTLKAAPAEFAAAPPGAERGVCSQGQSTVLAFPEGPPPPSAELPGWEDRACVSNLDVRRNIFCNRSLNMRSIKAVGFDMDYTLSQYKPETFEKLAHDLTVEKLVGVFGYPEIIATWKFDWRYMVRGLTIDKQRGNILKIDRHKYVKIAYHGFRELSRAERRAIYSDSNFEFDEPDFAMIDTLFSLAEAHLFMQLVELQDSQPDLLPPGKTRPDLYRDVRAAVDLCHRDGSLKQAVAKDPAKYIHEDSRLIGIMDMYRAAGKKLFVATNSLWDYTHVVMNFLLTGRVGSDRNEEWLEYFDVVITGCGKPAFFNSRQAHV